MTIILFVIILAVLVFVHEFGHFITAKKSGIRVDEFGIGFPPKIFSWKPKKSETTYSINAIPFGGFVKIFGEDPDDDSISGPESNRSFVNKPKSIQALVLVAGVLFNIIFAWFLITLGYWIGFPTNVTEENINYAQSVNLTIVGVVPDSPADIAGLKPGDSLISVSSVNNSIDMPNADEVRNLILESGGEDISIEYGRGKETGQVDLLAEGGLVDEGVAIGIIMDDIGIVKYPVLKGLVEGTKTTINLLLLIAEGLAVFIMNAFTGKANLSQISGPVGIIGLVGDASRLGFVYLLSFTALISLHLAILNLIPFPALDGGRILFILIEKLKGSPISPKIQNWTNGIGFALLIILMLVVTYSDIAKLF